MTHSNKKISIKGNKNLIVDNDDVCFCISSLQAPQLQKEKTKSFQGDLLLDPNK